LPFHLGNLPSTLKVGLGPMNAMTDDLSFSLTDKKGGEGMQFAE
jgi:hypothetical protein